MGTIISDDFTGYLIIYVIIYLINYKSRISFLDTITFRLACSTKKCRAWIVNLYPNQFDRIISTFLETVSWVVVHIHEECSNRHTDLCIVIRVLLILLKLFGV